MRYSVSYIVHKLKLHYTDIARKTAVMMVKSKLNSETTNPEDAQF